MLKFGLDALQHKPTNRRELHQRDLRLPMETSRGLHPLAVNGQQQRRQAKENHNCKERGRDAVCGRFRILFRTCLEGPQRRGSGTDSYIKNYGERMEG